ncbi:MAG: DUF190 domain-containing protein [Sideroxydans sp.]|nr:DUF190 domain-containing protein [Sideroxydans sp.]
MQAVVLRFYVSEKQHHHGELAYEWLLRQAQVSGLSGGSVFRAIAGFGRHGKMHEEMFFELAGELAVVIEFVTSEADAEKLLAALRDEELKLHYIRYLVESGMTGSE